MKLTSDTGEEICHGTDHIAVLKGGKSGPRIWQTSILWPCGECQQQMYVGQLVTVRGNLRKGPIALICKQCRPFSIIGQYIDE